MTQAVVITGARAGIASRHRAALRVPRAPA